MPHSDLSNIQKEKTKEGRLMLTNITMEAAGTYICKVEAAETGANDKGDKSMFVYGIKIASHFF
jgi:hypothetical protein